MIISNNQHDKIFGVYNQSTYQRKRWMRYARNVNWIQAVNNFYIDEAGDKPVPYTAEGPHSA